ncbi:MAG: hypothetical protein J6U43_05335, partial [Bacteroidales bacterium]|nr:hypothetical protein [Bacteroidales bacterium]
MQREGKYEEAIATFKNYLSEPQNADDLSDQELFLYTEALVQLMNTYQSKGEPEECIYALEEIFKASPILQKQCLRDYHSVMGYALSRTEKMKSAEESILKVFTLPLYRATPERYFRDYAYASAVFYSNPNYQNEVINWCQEAIKQAGLCKNTSGKQWVTAMLGSLYKRNGHLNKALELFQQSKEEAEAKNDSLAILNSLHALIDLFLYWNTPEYANIYASEAVGVEKSMATTNPMVSAQTYINKGRALHQLGIMDSVSIYTERARALCQSLPYNSGMVDVHLLHGTLLTEIGGDSTLAGINELQQVTLQGTNINRAKAYHQLAQTYLKTGKDNIAEIMLDSMYLLLTQHDNPTYIQLNYKPILNHYLKTRNDDKIEQYTRLMLQEQQVFKEKSVNFNLVESIVDLKIEQKRQELKISQLKHANQRLLLIICIATSIIVISCIVAYIFNQKKQHLMQMKLANEKLLLLAQQINQLNSEEEIRKQEIKEFLKTKDNRHELETLTPSILQTDGESKFRQYFELLHPLFLPRIREKVPTIT